MPNVELDNSDSGGSAFAGFDEEKTRRRNIGETTRVIARAAVGVTVSESDSDSSDATIVVITGTVITRIKRTYTDSYFIWFICRSWILLQANYLRGK